MIFKDFSSNRMIHTQNENSLFVLIEYLSSVYVDVLEETENLENNEVKSEGLSKLREHKNEKLKKKRRILRKYLMTCPYIRCFNRC